MTHRKIIQHKQTGDNTRIPRPLRLRIQELVKEYMKGDVLNEVHELNLEFPEALTYITEQHNIITQLPFEIGTAKYFVDLRPEIGAKMQDNIKYNQKPQAWAARLAKLDGLLYELIYFKCQHAEILTNISYNGVEDLTPQQPQAQFVFNSLPTMETKTAHIKAILSASQAAKFYEENEAEQATQKQFLKVKTLFFKTLFF